MTSNCWAMQCFREVIIFEYVCVYGRLYLFNLLGAVKLIIRFASPVRVNFISPCQTILLLIFPCVSILWALLPHLYTLVYFQVYLWHWCRKIRHQSSMSVHPHYICQLVVRLLVLSSSKVLIPGQYLVSLTHKCSTALVHKRTMPSIPSFWENKIAAVWGEKYRIQRVPCQTFFPVTQI